MIEEGAHFAPNGCSGGLSRAWRFLFRKAPPWEGLCDEHDRAYWAGGTPEMRKHADLTLMAGTVLVGHPHWAYVIYLAVRLGGRFHVWKGRLSR